jgi:outer membrane cobalamin receptor
LLLSVPLPGLNFLNQTSYAIDRSAQIKGRVIDADTKSTIEYATITLVLLPDTLPVEITASDSKGEFSFKNLLQGNYKVTVHFMGFLNYTTPILTISGKSTVLKLETIAIRIDTQFLNEITVRANASTPSYQIDKKTIYVENQLAGAGGSASDLLHKLPSVSQTPDGQIAFHGNTNLLVYINGKPSSMKGSELLENTPAAQVKKIELITSPSAKYDASGSGGIINLITKKNSSDGINGNMQASADHLGGYSSDLLLNFKYNKYSFFAGLDHNMRRNQGEIEYTTTYLSDMTSLNQTGIQKSQRINTGFRTGVDYLASLSDIISVSGNIGNFETTNNGDWQTVKTFATSAAPIRNNASDSNDRTGNYAGADFTYEHKFTKPSKSISFSVIWNKLDYKDNFLNLISDENGQEQLRQTTLLDKDYDNCQLNADYTTPTGKAGLLEMGYQLSFNDEEEDYRSTISNPLPPAVTTQNTQFLETVQAGYGTWQFKHNNLEVKAGLRAENLNRELQTSDKTYTLHRLDFYPSLNSSFKIDSVHEILLNYSRRTDQLKTIQLDPLPRWYDFYNVLIGNPDLKNEITDKIALDYLINIRHLTLSNELYYYRTSDKIEVIRSLYHDGIVQNRYENTGTESTWGVEADANWSVNSWLKIDEKLDFIDSRLDVTLPSIAQKRSYQQWYSVTTADFNLSPTMTLEVDFSYYGPALTAQSDVEKCYLAGLSFRKTFFSKKLSFSVTGRDVLGLYRRTEHIQGADFNQISSTHNTFPIRFSLSYKFNHYKRDERRIAKSPLAE